MTTTVSIHGSEFLPGASVVLGSGITVNVVDVVSETQLDVSVTPATGAGSGLRDV